MKQADDGVFVVIVGIPFGVPFSVPFSAVGQACGANLFALPVACHRVSAASSLGGFLQHVTGFHIGVKCKLLAHKGRAIKWRRETRQTAR